jgi:hypothetical protein
MGSNDENLGKPTGKWASEFYDFVRIFRRVSSSVYGLLLVEIAWVVFLILVQRLSPGSARPTVTVPFANAAVSVSDLLIPGGFILLALWTVWSRLALYGVLPLRFLIARFLTAVSLLVFLVAFVLLVVTWPLRAPIESFLTKRWEKSVTDADRAELKSRIRVLEARLNLLALLPDRRALDRKLGADCATSFLKKRSKRSEEESKALEDRKRELALSELLESKHGILRWLDPGALFRGWLAAIRGFTTRAYIGIAAIQTETYEEDLNAARAPTQAFASAVSRLRWRFLALPALANVKFVHLPPHGQPKNGEQAERLRRVLGLDVLIWGSYVPGSAETLWLNLAQRPRETVALAIRQKKDSSLFPRRPEQELSTTAVVADQDDVSQAYVAIVLAVLAVLRARGRRRFTPWRPTDLLHDSDDLANQLMESLVFDIFPLIPGPPAGPPLPFAWRAVVEVAGNWVGSSLQPADTKGEEFVETNLDELNRVIDKCIELQPTAADFYRLGALRCLQGNPEGAIKSFGMGKALEGIRAYESGIRAIVDAQLELDAVIHHFGGDQFEIARTAALIARSVNLAGHWALESLTEQYVESLLNALWRSRKDPAERAGVEVIQRLLGVEVPAGNGSAGN